MTDCPACRAVALGGRIRVTEDTGILAENLFVAERRRVLGERRTVLDAMALDGENIERLAYVAAADKRLKQLDLLLGEIRRTLDEMPFDGEPQ